MTSTSTMEPSLQELLKSTETAGARTRTTIVALVIACVLAGIAFLNSWHFGWIAQRARKAAWDDEYAGKRLGLLDHFGQQFGEKEAAQSKGISRGEAFTQEQKEKEEKQVENETKSHRQRAQDFSKTLINEYAINGYQVKIPFFGSVIDVYDMGLVAGVGFTIILFLLYYSLNTEITALRLVFSDTSRPSPPHFVGHLNATPL